MAAGLTGVILAAGRGERMAPFGQAIPKAALPIANKPLIEYQIEQMRALGISEVAVLVGHRGYQIAAILGNGERLGMRVRYVEQTEMAGIAHALGQMEAVVPGRFLLMLGDIFFEPRDLGDMIDTYDRFGCAAVLAAKTEHDPLAIRKNFAILCDADGRVRRVIEKPRHAENRLKGVGLYLFDPTIFDAVKRTPRTAMRNEYELTDSIQILIDQGHPVRVSDCIADDINLTFPSDLLRCNLRVAASRSGGNVVDASARLHPDAVMENVVIGRSASVERGITVRRSVILDEAVVKGGQDLDGFVISPTRMVDCRTEIADWPAGLGL